MSDYQIFQYVSLGCAIACGVFLVIAVILFFTLRIPKVISDLSGRTARRAIEDIRRRNTEGGEQNYKPSAVNRDRGRLTDKISRSGRLVPQQAGNLSGGANTEKIGTQKLQQPAGETMPLNQAFAGETMPLSQSMAGETMPLTQEMAGETALLTPNTMGETMPLSQAPARGETAQLSAQPVAAVSQADPAFAVVYEITYIHTNETIG